MCECVEGEGNKQGIYTSTSDPISQFDRDKPEG